MIEIRGKYSKLSGAAARTGMENEKYNKKVVEGKHICI